MTQVDTFEDTEGGSRTGLVGWLRAKDPDLLVVKRSVRAAIVMPAIFAIAHTYFSSPQVGLFAAFGSFSLLLLVEFTGPVRTRVASYLSMFAVSAALIAVGTAVSTNKVGSVVAMGVVGFAVLFAGIVSPRAATASTAVLLNFVLPVAVAQPASAIGDRLLGLVLAGAASISACLLWWPPPWHDNLRRRLSAAADAIGRLACAQAQGDADPSLHTEVSDALGSAPHAVLGDVLPPDRGGFQCHRTVQARRASRMGGQLRHAAARRPPSFRPPLRQRTRAGEGGHRGVGGDAPRSSRTYLRR